MCFSSFPSFFFLPLYAYPFVYLFYVMKNSKQYLKHMQLVGYGQNSVDSLSIYNTSWYLGGTWQLLRFRNPVLFIKGPLNFHSIQVLSLVPKEQDGENFDNALARVRRCVGGGTEADNADSDSDIEVVADSVSVNLRCPVSTVTISENALGP